MIPYITINLDIPRKLRFGMKAMVEFEQLTGVKLMELEENMSFTIAAQALWIMLKQEENTLTFDNILNLVDERAENISEVIQKVTEAIQVAFKTGNLPNAQMPKK